MNRIPGLKADVGFGGAATKLPDWRKAKDNEVDPDDEEIATPEDVKAVLGFDPGKAEETEGQTEEAGPVSKKDMLVNRKAKRKAVANSTSLAAASPSPMIGKYATGKRQKMGLNAGGGLPGQQQRDPADFDLAQLAAGTRHEKEHTSDPQVARRIAMDHLAEDGDYYRKLKGCMGK